MIARRILIASLLGCGLLALGVAAVPVPVVDDAHGWALTIRVADVDRDNDLDVVMSAPLSAVTIAVWLNDGHGHFTPGPATPSAAPVSSRTIEPAGTTVGNDSADDSLGTDAFVDVSAAAAPPPCGRSRMPVAHAIAHAALDAPPANPRAPPALDRTSPTIS